MVVFLATSALSAGKQATGSANARRLTAEHQQHQLDGSHQGEDVRVQCPEPGHCIRTLLVQHARVQVAPRAHTPTTFCDNNRNDNI